MSDEEIRTPFADTVDFHDGVITGMVGVLSALTEALIESNVLLPKLLAEHVDALLQSEALQSMDNQITREFIESYRSQIAPYVDRK